MKKLFYSIVVSIMLCSLSSCENVAQQTKEPLQNTMTMCEGCDFDVYNGEELGFKYWCQFATSVDIVITDYNNEVLQEVSRQLEPFPAGGEPGYRRFCFKIDVGDYRGRATFAMRYEDLKNPGEAARVKLLVENMTIGDRGAVTLEGLKITRIYEESVQFSVVVGNADEFAFYWVPASEYVEQSADEIFEKGWTIDMLEYGSSWGGSYYNPKTYATSINRLSPDTEYVLQLAAKNEISVVTEQITFRTKAPEPPTPPVDFKSLEIESITESTITLTAEIANTKQLLYHICEGESCDCEFETIMAGMRVVWREDQTQSSFENPIKVTFEIKNLRPSTTYYIEVNAGAQYTSQKRTLVVTTAVGD